MQPAVYLLHARRRTRLDPTEDILTGEELIRVIRLFVDEGVTEVRFTGGEPMLRPDLEQIIEGVASLVDAPSISLTTNGIGLDSRACGCGMPVSPGSTFLSTPWIVNASRP